MAVNFPGPLELRMNYIVTLSSVALSHSQRLNLNVATEPDVGEDPNNIDCIDKNGGTRSAQDIYTDWLAVMKGVFANTAAFPNTEFWWYTPGTNDAKYITSVSASDVGTNGGSNQVAAQMIYTFRTQEGGIMRVNMMESAYNYSQPKAYASLDSAQQAVVDYILSGYAAASFIGKDTSYPISFNKMFPGQNEALFKKRYRISE